ncbi:hypothetical protein AB1N83_013633, partial [Pleurotus pulmonarius]
MRVLSVASLAARSRCFSSLGEVFHTSRTCYIYKLIPGFTLLCSSLCSSLFPPTMFASVYTLAFFAAVAAALQIEPLQNANSQGDTRITWINDAADTSRFSTFSVFLHHPTFNSDFALLNNQRPTDGGANVTLPAVPAHGRAASPIHPPLLGS